MTTFARGNTPTFTLDELTALIRDALPSSIVDTEITKATNYVLGALGQYLRTVHYVDVAVVCTGYGACSVDLGGLGARAVSDVLVRGCDHCNASCCNASCWRSAGWFRMQGTTLLVDGPVRGDVLRLEFTASPPLYIMGTVYTTEVDFDSSASTDLALNWVETGTLPIEPGRFPAAGYVRLDTTEHVLEYVGRTFTRSDTRLTLHNVSAPGFVAEPVVVATGATLHFVAPYRDPALMDVARFMALANYWQTQLTGCIADADRSFASQMMVFYAGERDKVVRSLHTLRPRTRTRLLYRPEPGFGRGAACTVPSANYDPAYVLYQNH